MFTLRHANRLCCSGLLRSHSTGPVKVASKVIRATALDDKDIFGTLSESGRKELDVRYADKNLPDDPDGYDKIEFDIEPRKNAYYYKYEITKYARQGGPGLRRALELFQEMKAKARLMPTMDNFSPLIYGCAKAGYTKRAFDLYDESLRYLPKPSNSMITCLINSCAESPFPEYGIERLKWFLPHVKSNYNRALNEKHYNCAIKAFGKLGQLEEASKLVQEMINEGLTPTVDTFNMLLIGCASNKDAGCSVALRVFKRLKMYQLQPTVVTYRLFLRCIRDCGIGSPELIKRTLEELPAVTSHDQRLKYKRSQVHHKQRELRKSRKSDQNFTWMPLISDIGVSIEKAIEEPQKNAHDKSLVRVESKFKPQGTKDIDTAKDGPSLQHDLTPEISHPFEGARSHQLTTSNNINQIQLPNLLSDDHLDLVMRIRAIKFDNLQAGRDRILLFGGFYGYMEAMMKDGCKPDSKTFSLILDCLEGTTKNYLAYHKLAGEMKVERDLLFYDLLIRHICRFGINMNRVEFALEFVEKMHLDQQRPNISTFESLALGCYNYKTAKRLLDDINKCGFIPSEVLIYNLIKSGIKSNQFFYLTRMIEYCERAKFQPNKLLIDNLEDLRLRAGQIILEQERQQPKTTTSDGSQMVTFDERTIEAYDVFRSKLGHWLKEVELKSEDHPWGQFKVDTSSKRDGMREYERHFNAMERAKRETQEQGHTRFGNLTEKAKRMVAESQA